MEFKLCYIGSDLYGDARLLDSDVNAGSLQRTVTRMNAKQGTEYTYKNKNLENLIFEHDPDQSQ